MSNKLHINYSHAQIKQFFSRRGGYLSLPGRGGRSKAYSRYNCTMYIFKKFEISGGRGGGGWLDPCRTVMHFNLYHCNGSTAKKARGFHCINDTVSHIDSLCKNDKNKLNNNNVKGFLSIVSHPSWQ